MRKNRISILLSILAALLLAIPAAAQSPTFPDVIALPTGFQPEGIAVGQGSTFFTGSLADGRVLRGDLRTGQFDVLVPGQAGTVSVGMKYDGRSDALFVAGGPTGTARVFNATSGALLATYALADPGNFINDVIVTQDAAYFTNSSQAVFYRLPLGPNGELPDASAVQTIPFTGDWEQVPNAFNANGIEAASNGKWLIVVNSTLGTLYRVDPASGDASEIVLDGESVSAGDGLLLQGFLLYVMRNQLNQIVVIDLSRSMDTDSGVVVDRITSPDFAVPTTLAAFGDSLYTVNAKFGFPSPATQGYEVVRVARR